MSVWGAVRYFQVLASAFEHVDVLLVPAVSVVIQPVAYNKVVADVETRVIHVDVDLQVLRLDQKRSQMDACRFVVGEQGPHVFHRDSGIYDVFNDDDMTVFKGSVDAHDFLDLARAAGPDVGGQAYKTDLTRNVYLFEQVGCKHEGTVEHNKKYGVLVSKVTMNLAPHFLNALPDLLLGNV